MCKLRQKGRDMQLSGASTFLTSINNYNTTNHTTPIRVAITYTKNPNISTNTSVLAHKLDSLQQ
jgi:hypothetical protein